MHSFQAGSGGESWGAWKRIPTNTGPQLSQRSNKMWGTPSVWHHCGTWHRISDSCAFSKDSVSLSTCSPWLVHVAGTEVGDQSKTSDTLNKEIDKHIPGRGPEGQRWLYRRVQWGQTHCSRTAGFIHKCKRSPVDRNYLCISCYTVVKNILQAYLICVQCFTVEMTSGISLAFLYCYFLLLTDQHIHQYQITEDSNCLQLINWTLKRANYD